MEEQKKIQMEPEVSSGEQKLTYEELNDACADMSQQLQNQDAYIKQMYKQMQQMNLALQSKRMDYLMKVVELSNVPSIKWSFNPEFVQLCMNEIEELLTPVKEEKKAEEN